MPDATTATSSLAASPIDDLTRAHGFIVELLGQWAATEERFGAAWHRGVDVRSDVMDRWTARAEALGSAVTAYRCAGEVTAPSDGHDIPAFVVMSEPKTELAYKGVHTREAAESLAGGFDDVEVRGAEDVIRELCEQVTSAPSVATCRCGHSQDEHIDYGHGGCSANDGVNPLCDCVRFAAPSGEPYLHTLRCVKDACTEDCPRRHEGEPSAADAAEGDDALGEPWDSLADALYSAWHEGVHQRPIDHQERARLTLPVVIRDATPAPDLRAALVEALLSHRELANGWSDRADGYTEPQDDGGPSIVDLLVAAVGHAAPGLAAEVARAEPSIVGVDALYHDAADNARAVAIWTTGDDCSVWVDEDGELNAKSRYSGHCVTAEIGRLILAADRWTETKMPPARGEVITVERARNAPDGTLLARVGEDRRPIPGLPVVRKDGGFDAPAGSEFRVLDLPATVGSS